MQKLKGIIGFVVIIAASFTCFSVADGIERLKDRDNQFEEIHESSISTKKNQPRDDNVVVQNNCDPKMLMPGDPNLDPGMLVKGDPSIDPGFLLPRETNIP